MDENFQYVSEVMTKRPLVIRSGSSVVKSAKLMKKYDVSSILVMHRKQLLGIITVDDIANRLVAEEKDAKETTVDEVMTKAVITVTPNTTISEAMDQMKDHEIRQLPVLEKEELLGFVTMKDLLRIEPTLSDLMVESIRFEEQRRQQAIQQYVETGQFDDHLFD